MPPVRLVTLAPGHFHAALIQKEMQPGIDRTVHVYGPLDADLTTHIGRITAFNCREIDPTAWQLEVHASDDWPERFLRERPGNVAILSGRNRPKIDLMRLAVEAGMHVLADKPWIIESDDLLKLESVMDRARKSGLVLHDMMTERFEITSIFQRELINDADLFGIVEAAGPEEPAVYMESVHYLKKVVAGAPLRRPGWFFDIAQQGEALSDVGTHLVDLVLWTLFQAKPVGNATILDARRWPTLIDPGQFQSITGLGEFPPELEPWIEEGRLHYYCNNQVVYELNGVRVRLDVLWDYEAPAGGGDTHNAIYYGSRCAVAIRQQGGRLPELFVMPKADQRLRVRDELARHVDAWQRQYPGVKTIAVGDEFQILIPEVYRTGHEAHFAEVTAQFLRYVESPNSVPDWEAPHLLTKYRTTTRGVEFARRSGV